MRLIEVAALDLSPGRMALVGANASGKTSLLEAVYMLGTGRSFLTPKAAQAIQHDQQELTLFGALRDEAGTTETPMGVSRGRGGDYKAKLNGEVVRSTAQLAAQLPLQLITPDALSFIVQGPDQRRAFLDLGLFHTQSAFKETVQEYRQHLKQRNAWLRAGGGGGDAECVAWEAGLVRTGERVATMRVAYIQDLLPHFKATATDLLEDLAIEIQLQQGWNSKIGLAESLSAGRASDMAVGHTQSGPHRADLVFMVEGRRAKEVLSRGQQKMLVCALKFAQERLLREVTGGRASMFLIDDLASELDDKHLGLVLQQIAGLNCQAFLTMLNQETYDKMRRLGEVQPQTEDFFAAGFSLNSGQLQPLCST